MDKKSLHSGKKVLAAICLILFYLETSAQSFTLNGVIRGKDTGVVLLHYRNAIGLPCSDTAVINRGNFTFKGTVQGADYAFLDTDTSYIYGR